MTYYDNTTEQKARVCRTENRLVEQKIRVFLFCKQNSSVLLLYIKFFNCVKKIKNKKNR